MINWRSFHKLSYSFWSHLSLVFTSSLMLFCVLSNSVVLDDQLLQLKLVLLLVLAGGTLGHDYHLFPCMEA